MKRRQAPSSVGLRQQIIFNWELHSRQTFPTGPGWIPVPNLSSPSNKTVNLLSVALSVGGPWPLTPHLLYLQNRVIESSSLHPHFTFPLAAGMFLMTGSTERGFVLYCVTLLGMQSVQAERKGRSSFRFLWSGS